MKYLKITNLFLILLGCVFLASCLDDNVTSPETKKNDKFQNGTQTSLEGTVWVHHPDTDPESTNWFNFYQNPSLPGFSTYYDDAPAKLSFTSDRILDGGDILENLQRYYYTYDYPKVLVSMRLVQPDYCICPNPMSFTKTTECKCHNLWFIGNVNETGDTMNLRHHRWDTNGVEVLYRDVVLIRVK